MMNNDYPHGTFCWIDLATSDLSTAKEFYSKLFGWRAVEEESPNGIYCMFFLNEKDVCACYEMPQEMTIQGVPSHWNSYVAVADLTASTERVSELGGTVLQGDIEVGEPGRMAIVQDPDGATFMLWQGKNHPGAGIVNEPGSFCWNELSTHDLDGSEKFYTQLFGWTANRGAGAMGQVYVEFKNGDRSNGGMLEIQPDWGDMPSSWGVYFCVADINAAVQKVAELGGKVEMPPTAIENIGTFALVVDAVGAYFCLIEMGDMVE